MLGGRPACGSESQRHIERNALVRHDYCNQLTISGNDDVLQQSDLSSVPLDRATPQPAERKRAGAVEVQLVLLEEDKRRQDSDCVAADRRRRKRQKAVHFVAA